MELKIWQHYTWLPSFGVCYEIERRGDIALISWLFHPDKLEEAQKTVAIEELVAPPEPEKPKSLEYYTIEELVLLTGTAAGVKEAILAIAKSIPIIKDVP